MPRLANNDDKNMKSTVFLLLGLGAGLALAVAYFKRVQPALSPAPVAAVIPAPAPEEPAFVNVPPKPPTIAAEPKPKVVIAPATNVVASAAEPESTGALRKTIDALLSPQTTGKQKHELFEQLRNSGQIDQAITELKRRATENPADPEIQTTLGEAMLNKVRLLHESGADVNEVGILAMQADQTFNAALKLDPSNWEAQFVKYSSMFYWPADAKRDTETAQKLASLIDQQEAAPQQPEFVQTYIVLGNQYQKMGKTDLARATWQLGLQKFPSDPTLLKKVNSQ